MSKFAERLKELRIEKGLTRKEFANKVGVFTPAAVGLWEKGKRVPNFDVVISIAQFFGVSIDYLAGLED